MSMRSASPTTTVASQTSSLSVPATPVLRRRDVVADGADAYRDLPNQRFTSEVRSGTTIYADGRFYLCAGRLGLGGDGDDDILVLARVPLSQGVDSELYCSTAADLDELARQGRAATVGKDEPRQSFAACPPQPMPAGPAAVAVAMPV